MASPKIRGLRLLAGGLVVAVVVTTMTLRLRMPPRLPWCGFVRLLVVKQTNAVASFTPYNPYFLQNLFDDIKRTTTNPDFISTLGKASARKTNEFLFRKVHGFRSTSIIELRYDAADRTSAEIVSTNAAALLRSMFTTNYPAILGELMEVRTTTVWEESEKKMRNRMGYWIWRITHWPWHW
jgi:hypothetical protein